jgi:hypothetical protein
MYVHVKIENTHTGIDTDAEELHFTDLGGERNDSDERFHHLKYIHG